MDSARRGVSSIGGGGVKTLLFCLGTAYNVFSMEDIDSPKSLHERFGHTKQNIYLKIKNTTHANLFRTAHKYRI